MEKRYSLNDEDFCHEDRCDVMTELLDIGKLCIGHVYYEVDIEPCDVGQFLYAEDVLEQADQRLYEEIGEVADSEYQSVSAEGKDELSILLLEWEKKWVLRGRLTSYWKAVGKSRECVVTFDDVTTHSDNTST